MAEDKYRSKNEVIVIPHDFCFDDCSHASFSWGGNARDPPNRCHQSVSVMMILLRYSQYCDLNCILEDSRLLFAILTDLTRRRVAN